MKATPQRLKRESALCLLAAALLVSAHLVWHVSAADLSPPILPPAGEAIPGEAPIHFAVMGDSQGNQTVFERVLGRVKAEDVHLVLHLGDIMHHCTSRDLEWILHELDEENLDVPFCVVPGNHDIDKEGHGGSPWDLYNAAFGPRRYWFTCGNVLFVALDDSTESCTAEDVDWIDRTLATQGGSCNARVVFMHVPPRDPRPGKGHALHEGGEELMAVLARHDVTVVFAGHIHSYLEDRIADIPVYITGGAGADLQEPSDRYHYLLCTVRGDGSFTVEKEEVEGVADTDYLEYVFRVRFPGRLAPVAAVVLLLLGLGSRVAFGVL